MDAMTAYNKISSIYDSMGQKQLEPKVEKDNGFQSIFQSALDMVNGTSDLQNRAEAAEIQFALGLSNNTHDLQIAQEKANVALQYTVAVRDKVIEGYKEIMAMNI